MELDEYAESEYPIIWNIFKGKYEDGHIWNAFTLDNMATTVRKDNLAFDHPRVKSYNVNSMGFRSQEFVECPDLLVAGCSQTFGEGLLEEYRWGDMLAKKLEVSSYVNLSMSGWSIGFIVYNLFHYFRIYGDPKKLAISFPDPYRMAMAYNTDVAVDWDSTSKRPDITKPAGGIHHNSLEQTRTVPKYSKAPYYLRDILPYETAIYDGVKAIQMLIQYCKKANIDLVWGSWSLHSSYLFEDIAYEFRLPIDKSSYVSIGDATHRDLDLGCHEEFKEESGDLFYQAADGNIYGTSHMGYHANIHIAERFYEKLKG